MQNANNIPLVRLQGGAHEYEQMMHARVVRFLAIAPGSYLGVPMTPLAPNPDTGNSYHIVRLINDWAEEGVAVDLLFRDQNMYFVAFRRVVNEVGQQWYSFRHEEVPDFINAIVIRLGSSHESREDTTIGGVNSLNGMFEEFSNYAGEESLRRAKARAIITFGEALRFWSVHREVIQRMVANPLMPYTLSEVMWRRILSWRVLCDFVIDIMRRLTLPENHPERQPDQARLASFAVPYQIHNLNELIGPHGEIRLILSRKRLMIRDETLEKKRNEPAAADIVEPEFGNGNP
ncbi:hypothetical protein ACP70R_021569 [Stipagrostis hirtigluma subsp. patula]